jgi:hypothetical protein
VDSSENAKVRGYEVHKVVNDEGTHKGIGMSGVPVTKSDLAEVRRVVNSIHANFAASVARGRDMSDEDVSALSTGKIYIAREAVENGLIDGVASFDSVLRSLQSQSGRLSAFYSFEDLTSSQVLPTAFIPAVPVASTNHQDDEARFRAVKGPKGMKFISNLFAQLTGKGVLSAEDAAKLEQEMRAELQAEKDAGMPKAEDTKPADASGNAASVFMETAEYQRMSAQLEQLKLDNRKKDAEAFATMMQDRIVPVERPMLIASYVLAAQDDERYPQTLSCTIDAADGKQEVISGTRLDILKRTYASRPKHHLMESMLPAGGEYAALFNQTVTSAGSKEAQHKEGYEEGKAFAKSLNGKGN